MNEPEGLTRNDTGTAAAKALTGANGSGRLGASGALWTPTGRRIDAEGVDVIQATDDRGYPTEFPRHEWLTIPIAPNDRTERQPPGTAAACNQTAQETKSA